MGISVIFEDNAIEVWENGSGEIIVKAKEGTASVRVTPLYDNGIRVTAHNFSVGSFNGLAAVTTY